MRFLCLIPMALQLAAQTNTLQYPTTLLPPADRSRGAELRIFADDRTTYGTIGYASGMTGLGINGRSTVNGSIVFNPGDVAGLASVNIISPTANEDDPSLILWDGDSDGATNGIKLNYRNGVSYLKIDSSGTSGDPVIAATAPRALRLSGQDIVISGGNVIPSPTNTLTLGTILGGVWADVMSTDVRVFDSLWVFEAFDLAASGVEIKSSDSITTDWTWILPVDNGDADECMLTDGAGVTRWDTCPGAGGSTLPVPDTTSLVEGSVDDTKEVRLEVDGLTTMTTRALTVQDASYIIAGTNIDQSISGFNTYTNNQTFAADIIASGASRDVGSAANFFENGYLQFLFSETITFVGSSMNRGAFGWNGSDGFAVTNNIAQTLFEFKVGGQNISYAALVPDVTSSRDLGTSSLVWEDGYIELLHSTTVDAISFTSVSGSQHVDHTVGGLTGVNASSIPVFGLGFSSNSGLLNLFDSSGNDTVTLDNNGVTSHGLAGASTRCGQITSAGLLTAASESCVTTAGGQSISGTTTLSTLSVSTAISGTFNLSGNQTVTGNLYLRTFSGADATCTGVANGWVGYRTDTDELQICNGSALKKVGLM